MSELYQQYVTHLQKIADINYSSAVLQWDQEVYMPPKRQNLLSPVIYA